MGHYLVQCDHSRWDECSQSWQLLHHRRRNLNLHLSRSSTRNLCFCQHRQECDHRAWLQYSQQYYRRWCCHRRELCSRSRITHWERSSTSSTLYCTTRQIDPSRTALGWKHSIICSWPHWLGAYRELHCELHKRSQRWGIWFLSFPKGVQARRSRIRRQHRNICGKEVLHKP